jgi:hypothetical protein
MDCYVVFVTNSPSNFMKLMNEVLKYCFGKFVIVYPDDILVFSKTEEEHLRNLTLVMRRLQRENFLINLKKSSFTKTKIIYLGFLISSNELKMDPNKVKEFKECSSPRSIFEVRIFHGLASLYWKFIINFSEINAQMMYKVNKRHKTFKWTEEDEKIFNILKEKITEQPILVFPYFRNTFQVSCDVSGVEIGVVLSQDNRPPVYFSEKLNNTKRN